MRFLFLLILPFLIQAQEDTTVYIVADQPPMYRDSLKELYRFMFENIDYPIQARDKGVEGRVFLRFIVEKDGSLSNFLPLKSPDDLLTKEAIRVVKLTSGDWIAGKNGGELVRVYNNLAVPFEIVANEPLIDSIRKKKPHFKGGVVELSRFIANNVKYPRQALEEGISGKVIISLVVEEDSSISNIKAVKSPHEVLSKEAVRVAELMQGHWNPAELGGKNIKATTTFPISFTMN